MAIAPQHEWRNKHLTGGIDHLVLCVPDLEEGRRFYERIGFNMTPLAYHPFGTANTLAQVQGSFLEVLSVADESLIPPHGDFDFSFAAFNRDFLSFAPGFSMLVFESKDARADEDRFRQAGLDTYRPFDFSRKATLPDGEEVTVGFSLAFVTHREMSRAVFFTCEQHAPEHFWKAEYQVHPNTAQTIEEVVMVMAAPTESIEFFVSLCGADALDEESGALIVNTPRGRIVVCTPKAFEDTYSCACPSFPEEGPRLVAFVVGVSDIETAQRKILTSGVPSIARGGKVIISGQDAFGTVIVFRQHSA